MNVKVIVVYLGERRSSPKTSLEAFRLLDYVVECELSVDPGCAMDTILVHNRDEGDPGLYYLDGMKTRAGKFILLERENTGLSFGGFSAAFSKFEDSYEYWAFTQDDCVLIRDGYYSKGIELLGDIGIGYVAFERAFVVSGSSHPPHCQGGQGITRRGVLRQVKDKFGKLPYYDSSEDLSVCGYNLWESYGGERYRYQEVLGEIRFTNCIYQMGYELVDYPEKVCKIWGT